MELTFRQRTAVHHESPGHRARGGRRTVTSRRAQAGLGRVAAGLRSRAATPPCAAGRLPTFAAPTGLLASDHLCTDRALVGIERPLPLGWVRMVSQASPSR